MNGLLSIILIYNTNFKCPFYNRLLYKIIGIVINMIGTNFCSPVPNEIKKLEKKSVYKLDKFNFSISLSSLAIGKF